VCHAAMGQRVTLIAPVDLSLSTRHRLDWGAAAKIFYPLIVTGEAIVGDQTFMDNAGLKLRYHAAKNPLAPRTVLSAAAGCTVDTAQPTARNRHLRQSSKPSDRRPSS
jgi:hypothetical protein